MIALDDCGQLCIFVPAQESKPGVFLVPEPDQSRRVPIDLAVPLALTKAQ